MNKITLDAIAKKLNVSKGLVSLALSDRYGVSEEQRSKILITAIQMGYDFDRLKRRKLGKNKKFFFVLTKDIDLKTDRYWPQILKGIEAKAAAENFLVRVKSWDNGTIPERFLAEVIDVTASGFIILSEIPEGIYENLMLSKIPTVVVDGKQNYSYMADLVCANNYIDFYQMTKCAIAKGHTKLAFVGDPGLSFSFNQRLHGFEDCIKENVRAQGVFLTDKGDVESYSFCYNHAQLLRSLSQRQASIYMCASDVIAGVVYKIADESGLKIPDDLSVTGFDDDYYAKSMKPPLSTVNISKNEMGAAAVDLLISRINNVERGFRCVGINGVIKNRESVKNITEKEKKDESN